MKPEEINKAIAEKVMGYTDVYFNKNYRVNDIMAMYARTDYSGDLRTSVGSFSTDISAAWQVVKKMRDKGQTMSMTSYSYRRTYVAFGEDIQNEEYCEANGENADSMAICLAALKAVS